MCFFKRHCLLFALRGSYGSKGENVLSAPADSVISVDTWVVSASRLLNSLALWAHWVSALLGHGEGRLQLRGLGTTDTRVLCISSAPVLAPRSHLTSLKNHKVKNKTIKTSMTVRAEHQSTHREGPPVSGPVQVAARGSGSVCLSSAPQMYLPILFCMFGPHQS